MRANAAFNIEEIVYMVFKRKIYDRLLEWKRESNGKPARLYQ